MTGKKLADYLWLIDRDRSQARELYANRFSEDVNDREVENELIEFLRDVDQQILDTGSVAVPLRLLLPIILRPRGKGRGNPGNERWKKRQEMDLVHTASVAWAMLTSAGVPTKAAKFRAAKETCEFSKVSSAHRYADVTERYLLSRMRLRLGRKHSARSRQS